jgi:hypothetical protein
MKPINLYAVEDKPFTKDELDRIVTSAIEAGYTPLNGVPRSMRSKVPYLSFHFIARDDVPDHH